MNTYRLSVRILVIGILLALLALSALPAAAQSGSAYTLVQSTAIGGGATNTVGGYALAGTMGQPNAGSVSGVPYVLAGGFWSGVQNAVGSQGGVFRLYLPFILR